MTSSEARRRYAQGLQEERAEITRQLTFSRLEFHYGWHRAVKIEDGRDRETNKDIARWRALGNRGVR